MTADGLRLMALNSCFGTRSRSVFGIFHPLCKKRLGPRVLLGVLSGCTRSNADAFAL